MLGEDYSINQARFAALCSELKCLYVAMTRARNTLWIWDTSSADPMKVGFHILAQRIVVLISY